MSKNSKSRKYLVTINNPLEHGYSHDSINSKMQNIKWVYYCLCDETGENGTPHTHLFFCTKNAVLFSTVKNLFPEAHIDSCKGSCQDNRDYIRKEGKHLNTDKKDTNHIDTFEEYGEMPLDKSAKNEKVAEQVLEMLEDGCSNIDIIRAFPSYLTKGKYLDDVRQELNKEKFGNIFRNIKVHYIYGASRTGKTRYVMEKYGGYDKVFRTPSYKNPFDGYDAHPVLLLDEFNSSIPIETLLKILEGYPFTLDARYNNKVACYGDVYIISNISLEEQYKEVQYNHPEQWEALLNRIDDIYLFTKKDKSIKEYRPDNVDIIELLKSDCRSSGEH